MTRFCKRFENCTLENYVCNTEQQKKLINTLKDINTDYDKNILIIGGVGTGKTHLAYALINKLAELKSSEVIKDYKYYEESKVIYRQAKEIIDEIHNGWKSGDSDISKYCKCPLLIIDEIGVQYGSDSERTELYTIFNRRYEDWLPIIAISNNSLPELQKILGQRIFDRLTGGALIFQINGKSYRQA